MKDVFDALHGTARDVDVCEVAFHEFDLRKMCEVLSLAGDQAVDDADALAATNELFAQVRPNEAGAAGDQIVSHGCRYCGKPDRDSPGMIFKAFSKYSFLRTSSGSAIPYSFQKAW